MDDTGTIWFVDDVKKVPWAYSKEARKIEYQNIRHYRAYTGPVADEEDQDRQSGTGD